ncbi:hypothetical protein J2S04_002394 [Alicyclobacillus tengchongensis]|uniref:Transposase n=2 Tax=Alicyclobacillus tolerans TaxID=90970 RepID=A0ABT9LYT4_9BACL|nr:hypothetical protein [Alicyclobacillus tengchongensis]SHK22038.1 hypothetical protein SAMN05443507_11068 [Alicyclobacillus montanus]
MYERIHKDDETHASVSVIRDCRKDTYWDRGYAYATKEAG